jgi:hypothetical protein
MDMEELLLFLEEALKAAGYCFELILEAVQLPKSLLCPPQDLAKETAERLQQQINQFLKGI